jgi:hypothetical protein
LGFWQKLVTLAISSSLAKSTWPSPILAFAKRYSASSRMRLRFAVINVFLLPKSEMMSSTKFQFSYGFYRALH